MTECGPGARVEDGAGRACEKDAIGGASNGCDIPSVVGGDVTGPERVKPEGEKELRPEYAALGPDAHWPGPPPGAP